MELCNHLKKIYQKEIANGNSVSMVGVYYYTGWKMCVYLNKSCGVKSFSHNLEVYNFVTPHYPPEFTVSCPDCKMSLSFPIVTTQQSKYEPSPLKPIPDPCVVASPDTVTVDDDHESDTGIRPTII